MKIPDFKYRPSQRTIVGAVLALLVAVVSVWSCRIEKKLDSVEQTFEQSGHKMGAAAGYVFVGGEQRYQLYTRAREYAVDWVNVPANTWTTIYTMPALVVGEVNVYAGLAIVTYDNSDASVNCDAGACDGVIRRYVPGRYQGGDFCRPDAVCASAGAFDMAVDWVVTDSGILTGAGARISWTAPSLVMQVFCPTACRAAGGISGQAMKPVSDAGVADTGSDSGDSGNDAADAADAADSSDAGPAPSIASVVPNYALAGGSPSAAITITGMNLLGGVPTVTFGGVAGTIISNTGTVATVTAPACTGAPLSCTAVNGVATKVAVAWTTSAGTGSSSGTFPNNFWYWPSTIDGIWSAQTVTNVAGNTHVILDESGNGFNTTANGSNCPWTATGEGSGQTPYITTTTCTGYTGTFFNQDAGTSEWFSSGTHLGPDGGTGFDKLVMAGNSMQLSSQGTARGLDEYNGSFANTLTFGTIGNTVFAADSLFNGASSYQQCCSGTLVNGGNPGTGASGSAFITIGASVTPDRPWIGRFVFLAHAPGTGVNSTARTMIQSYFNDQGLNPW
jgi:hypothetical protein